jgi:tetratricopeptide (TPR) repeat protein
MPPSAAFECQEDGHRRRPGGVAAAVLVAMVAGGLACATAKANPNAKAVQYQAEGARAYARGELDRAAGLFSLALEYDPRMAEARSGLGLVAFARGDKASAEQQFKAALSMNEDLAEAHHNLGLLQADRGDFEEAMASFRAALAIDPGFAAARLGVGDTLLQLDKTEEARWELAKLCEIDPQNPSAHASHARVLAKLNRIAAAEEAVQKALALDASLTSARKAKAEILSKRGDMLGALQEARAVVGAEPASIDNRVLLVTMLVAANMADEADRELIALEQAAPRRAEVAFLRAYVSLKRGQFVDAINAARRALRLRKPYPWARLVLAEALFMAGQPEEGRRETKNFLDEAPPSMERERREAERFLNR